MRHHADGVFVGGAAENFVLADIGADVVGGAARGSNIENHDVGNNLLRINRYTFDFRETVCEVAGILVVAMQSFWRFFQSDEAGGSENSDLAHSAAQQLPADVGLLDEVTRAEKQRTDGRSETFREAEHHRIEFAGEIGNAAAERNRRVEDSRAVEMHFQIRGVGVVADVVGNFLRIDGAALHVVRIFEATSAVCES